MNWLALSYSLPSKTSSSPRVTLWRRLRRLGAIPIAGGPQVLPARDDCEEAFGWLAQEIHDAGGEAVVMHVQRFAGLTDAQLIDLFQAARGADYDELDRTVAAVERASKSKNRTGVHDALEKAQKRLAEVTQVDYFSCPAGTRLAARLARIQDSLNPAPARAAVAHAQASDYQGRRWVTRSHPFIDRLACAWFIRRFVDPAAVIRYGLSPRPDEISFDMEDAHFGHRGNLCTFEVMCQMFRVDDAGARAVAEVVHEIDLRDGLYAPPEISGIEAILSGWLAAHLSDTELESRGIALFDGLYAALLGRPRPALQTKPSGRRKRTDSSTV